MPLFNAMRHKAFIHLSILPNTYKIRDVLTNRFKSLPTKEDVSERMETFKSSPVYQLKDDVCNSLFPFSNWYSYTPTVGDFNYLYWLKKPVTEQDDTKEITEQNIDEVFKVISSNLNDDKTLQLVNIIKDILLEREEVYKDICNTMGLLHPIKEPVDNIIFLPIFHTAGDSTWAEERAELFIKYLASKHSKYPQGLLDSIKCNLLSVPTDTICIEMFNLPKVISMLFYYIYNLTYFYDGTKEEIYKDLEIKSKQLNKVLPDINYAYTTFTMTLIDSIKKESESII